MTRKIIALTLGLIATISQFAQTQWPVINNTARPWTRWWWMGSAVDSRNIHSLLQQYSKAGFGGVEVVPIYGAKGFESKYIPYLSPKWMQMLDTAVSAAKKHHMGVDISVGTGWPIGGPGVRRQDAATKLVTQRYTIAAGKSFNEKILISDKNKDVSDDLTLSTLMAYSDKGGIRDLTKEVLPGGTLQWAPDENNWELIAAFTAKTLQKVKRAAPGGEGYTLDHFSPHALPNYLQATTQAFGNNSHGVRSFYNDSYEVYGADWTPGFFPSFEKINGYDLKRFLRELISKDSSDMVSRIKSDYRNTIATLMLENFADKFSTWAHTIKATTINQAHGSPGNLLDLYAAADIAETETFGSSYFPIPGLRRDSADIRNVDPDPNMLKFASSAAHVTGHPLASSETFTWLTEHFKTSWSQCKPELEQVFLSGINHVFFHGTTYSPKDVPWPGWLFYASVNFVPANSLWPHLKGMNDYIARCQSVLQAGKPDNEIALYWPVFDAWQHPKGLDMPLKVHDVDEWLHQTDFYKNVVALQKEGYSLDFVSDNMIAKAGINKRLFQVTPSGAAYKVLVIPACKKMPLETLEKIFQLANDGAFVIFEKFPADVPGLSNLETRRNRLQELKNEISFSEENNIKTAKKGAGKIILSQDIPAALQKLGLNGEALSKTGLKFIRRAVSGGKFYYIVNHTASDIDTAIDLNTQAKSISILNPQTGNQGLANTIINKEKTFVRLQLKAGEAWILKTNDKFINTKRWSYIEKEKEQIALDKNWQVSFVTGGPALPKARSVSKLTSWTTWGDTSLENFSGTAVYTTNFHLKQTTETEYLLQLGAVCESAKVWVNGKEAGLLWSIPFETRIGHLLKEGSNQIKIEVSNLMANRIRFMDKNNIPWRNYHEINFVNINYKNFDASGWPLQPSGLIGPVTITAFSRQ
ncbi:MAG: glycosyl hydrolase [Bacteroidota bacterium]